MKIETYACRTPGWSFSVGIWDGAGIYCFELTFWKLRLGVQLSFGE